MSEIKRIVIWGLRKKYHTHRHIHQNFFKNAKKLGYETIWVEDEKANQRLIRPGDLIIAAEVYGRMVPQKTKREEYNIPVRDDVFYCLHNFDSDIFKRDLDPKRFINLRFWSNEIAKKPTDEQWGPARVFDPTTNTLYQPWGTDLLAREFKKPVFTRTKFVFWVGSIWNDKMNRGNINAIDELKTALKKFGLKFVRVRFVPDFLNRLFIRRSRIAPGIAGDHQVKVDYLPCRVFKNISYGQLGITNVRKFKDLLGDAFVEGRTMEELIGNALTLSREEYLAKVAAQQRAIASFTYKEALENIITAVRRAGEKT